MSLASHRIGVCWGVSLLIGFARMPLLIRFAGCLSSERLPQDASLLIPFARMVLYSIKATSIAVLNMQMRNPVRALSHVRLVRWVPVHVNLGSRLCSTSPTTSRMRVVSSNEAHWCVMNWQGCLACAW